MSSPGQSSDSSKPVANGQVSFHFEEGKDGGEAPAIELTAMDNSNQQAAAPAQTRNDAHDDEEMESKIGVLLSAASKNRVDKILLLLRSGVPVDCADYDKRTALHLAASEGHIDAVKLLAEEGADINAKDRFGSTPFDDAVNAHHSECIAFFKSINAQHGGQDKFEVKLLKACSENNQEEVKKLIEAGINVNTCDYDHRTPLHLTVAENHYELTKLLLEHGANPLAEDRWGLSPLADAHRRATRTGDDPITALFAKYVKTHKKSMFSFFSVFFFSWEIAMIIILGIFARYGHTSDGAVLSTAPEDAHSQDSTNRVYSFYQDVHVMIFIGFGFLMVFLKKHGYSSVGFTFLIGAFVIQWYQLTIGFWKNAFDGAFFNIPLDLEHLVRADFCAGSVLITFGVLLGKTNPQQMLAIAIIETIFYSLNEQIGLNMYVADLGGTMTIHMFGAFFGYACAFVMTPKQAHGHAQNGANYHSDILAMIGTIYLWLFWPSFNAALGAGQTQPRAVINTVLSLCGSCVSAFIFSHILRGEQKFHMVDIQNATLAGGVAMGACSDMLIQPGSAVGIGVFAGMLSVFGFVYVQPFLERKIGLHDTCGVNNLHGMPSLIGGFASVIAASQASRELYGSTLVQTFYAIDGGRSANKQAAIQFAYMVTSVLIGLASGGFTGLLINSRLFSPIPVSKNKDSLFLDSEHWEVPTLETPYYFDSRGEISRGTGTPLGVTAAAPVQEPEPEEDEFAEIGMTKQAKELKETQSALVNTQQKLNLLELQLNGLQRRVHAEKIAVIN